MLSEVSQNRRRQILDFITYMWNLKNKTNKYIYIYITKQKLTYRDREQASGYQWGNRRNEGQDRGRRLRDPNYYICNK